MTIPSTSGRVSVRPDFEALDMPLPDGAPTRTEDGSPWVRWTKYGDYSGWYAAGSRKPQVSGQPGFWEAVFLVACECAGGRLDQVHCCGRGILALGGLGVTMRSGYAQLLLHCCMLASPARFIEVMAPVIRESGAYTKETDKSPSGVALCVAPSGRAALDEESMRTLVMSGSDSYKWTSGQKYRAKVWVSACSELLRDQLMDAAQLSFIEEVTPMLLTERTRQAVKWPRNGPRDWWQYTHSQQMLWALALVLALADEEGTEKLMVAAVEAQTAEPDAPLGSEHVLRQVNLQIQEPCFDNAFRTRCLTAGKLLSEYMQVTL